MKPKSIGILGGAGPLAGAMLLERVFSFASSIYGCQKDAEFPQVFLMSFPFSEMLSLERNDDLIRRELKEGLNQLRQNKAEVLAIACNTLHAFLEDPSEDLISLPQEVVGALPVGEVPLVLCTSTSVKFEVHKRFFSCTYPETSLQDTVDQLIDLTLQGVDYRLIIEKLSALIFEQNERYIVLGCTELSLFTKDLFCAGKTIIDPLEMTAKRLVEISFNK